MHVLPAVNEAVAAHRTSGCPWCGVGEQPACPLLGLAGAVLDLVIRCWRMRKGLPYDPAGHAPRNLYAALRGGWLSADESATLREILGILDLAAAQADAAGTNLPVLAGIGIAVIDGYRMAIGTAPR